MQIPKFKYHPDPIHSGNIVPSQNVCVCCQTARGYIYKGSVYCKEKIREKICPWCISDGSAAKKFDATFSDDYPLIQAGIDEKIIEVTRRTPGYISWQQEVWLTHCNDACAFYGDATIDDIKKLDIETKVEIIKENKIDEKTWEQFVKNYAPGGNPSVFVYKCLHCKKMILSFDYT